MFKATLLASLLAVALAQGIPPPSCYPAGTGPATDCIRFINNFCNDVAKDQFRPGDSGSRCFNLPNGNRCDFIAFNSRNIVAAPSEINCRRVLDNAARRCDRGGSGRISPGNFYTFTVDPNAGRCAPGVQPGS